MDDDSTLEGGGGMSVSGGRADDSARRGGTSTAMGPLKCAESRVTSAPSVGTMVSSARARLNLKPTCLVEAWGGPLVASGVSRNNPDQRSRSRRWRSLGRRTPLAGRTCPDPRRPDERRLAQHRERFSKNPNVPQGNQSHLRNVKLKSVR